MSKGESQMKKGQLKYDMVKIDGGYVRLYYSRVVKCGKRYLKDYIFDRFGVYQAPFKSCGNRYEDKKRFRVWLLKTKGIDINSFKGHSALHHNKNGYLMLVPNWIHNISHIGYIGITGHSLSP